MMVKEGPSITPNTFSIPNFVCDSDTVGVVEELGFLDVLLSFLKWEIWVNIMPNTKVNMARYCIDVYLRFNQNDNKNVVATTLKFHNNTNSAGASNSSNTNVKLFVSAIIEKSYIIFLCQKLN